MKHKLLSFFVGSMILTSVAFAQEKKVSGRVTGADGKPLAGVTIAVQGSNVATQTDTNGNYSLSVPTGKVIVFRSVGFADKTLIVKEGQSAFNITLDDSSKELEEVVVTGYGQRQIKDLTGSQGSIKGDRIAAEPTLSFEQAMSGKMAGVQIGSTGGTLGDGMSVRIRGVNSISSSSLPLYVIDGVPMNAVENVNTFNSGDGTRFNPMALINSNDIETIEVLKDAAAAVLYGSRAANGVILITTKRGKNGVSNISFESKITSSRPSKLIDLLDGDQFISINNEKAKNAAPRYKGVVNVIAKDSDIDGDGTNDRTNWLDEVYRTGVGYDNSVSLSSGNEKGNFYGSARYLNQKGIIYKNELKSGQVRLNGDIKPTKWLKSGISLSYSKTVNDGVLTDRYIAGATVAALNAFPNVAIRNSNNIIGYNLSNSGYLGFGNNTTVLNGASVTGGNIANPVATLDKQLNQNTPEQILANGYIEVQPIQGLKITSKFGIDYLNNYEHQYSHPNIGGLGTAYLGLIQDNFRNRNQWVWQNYANYDKTFNEDHRLSVTLGTEYQFTKEKQVYAGASNISDEYFTDIIDGTFTSVAPGTDDVMGMTGGTVFSNGLESYFSRVGYGFKNKYLIDLAMRADAFSAFGKNSKWGYFPSASLGWVASEEDFLKSIDWISYAKLRASYGKVGNSRGIGSYASRDLYQGGSYASLNGYSAYQVGTPDLKWETSEKLDIGVDFNIMNNRFNFVVDYFNNNISGLILQAKPLYTTGVPSSEVGQAGSIFMNIGSMVNKGVEFTFNMKTIEKESFTWNTSFNFTAISNKVKELVTEGVDIVEGNSVASVGRSLGAYKLRRWAGVDEQTGNPMWYTADGAIKMYNPDTQSWTQDGKATTALTGADAVYTDKSGLPKYYGGLDNNITYKNFDFGVSVVYTGGFYIYNSTRAALLSNFFVNNSTEILDRWTAPGQKTDVARIVLTDNQANSASDRFLEKGDFLRVRTISLGYNFGGTALSRVGISKLRLFAQVYNPFVITGYKGQDPEVNSNRNNSNIAIGVDSRAVPQPRTYTFGLNVSL
ncbi:TonB-dependent receptor [Sphingobacterium siyangense]|uniref:SusC/RagA family TonB-linked outer membrane protein n=1 Tax=Sphingobacterium siyangense TaxID=459529 RepID=UPI002FD96D09